MSMSEKTKTKSPSSFGGIMIIAGTAIGAGMLALPIVTSGMWFGWALATIIIVWFAMLTSGLFILEANLHYPKGYHLGAIAKDILPPWIRWINDLSLLFVLYILTYAYITVGSPFLQDIISTIGINLSLPNTAEKITYIIIFGGLVMISTFMVDRITSIIMIAMVVTFILAIPSLLGHVKLDILLNVSQKNATYYPYILGGVAALVASFGYHGNVSSLVKYYDKDYKKVRISLIGGTLITAITYLVWIISTHGSIPREIFATEINIAQDPVSILISYAKNINLLTWFKNFAILSSFLGVTLGLFDYIADQLKLKDNFKGRFITALITYLPPLIAAILFPYGFVHAIGYAGLFATSWALIVPALMAYKTRKKYPNPTYQVKGGNIMIGFIIVFSIIVVISELLSISNILPKY